VSVCSILDGQTAQRSKSDLRRCSNMVKCVLLLPNSTAISWSERTWPPRQLKFICFRPGEMGVYLRWPVFGGWCLQLDVSKAYEWIEKVLMNNHDSLRWTWHHPLHLVDGIAQTQKVRTSSEKRRHMCGSRPAKILTQLSVNKVKEKVVEICWKCQQKWRIWKHSREAGWHGQFSSPQ